ncbi:MAG: biopolymer transporter ExbD [Planctomycetes bacterium]|nr:biopolymer transporter ExbD [Planctomycetota bacterium]
MRRAIHALVGDEPSLLLTSMIDCVFLLLIFFLLTFQFHSEEGLLRSWLPDWAGDRIETPPPPLLTVRVNLDYDRAANTCQALLDLRTEAGSAWDPELRAGSPRWDEIRDYIRAARDDFLGGSPDGLPVVIDATTRTPVKFVVRVMDICTGLGVRDISLAEPEIPID